MSDTVRFRLRSHVAWQAADGEVFLVDLAHGEGLGLNRSASWLWMQIAEGAPHDAAALAANYGIPLATAERDVTAYVDELMSAGLIESLP